MKRLFILITLTLLLGRVQGWSASYIDDPSCIRVDSFWVEGSMMAQTPLSLHVIATNTGNVYFDAVMWLLDANTKKGVDFSPELRTPMKPGETKELISYFQLDQPGTYTLEMVPVINFNYQYFSFTITVSEYKEPRLKGSLQIDMLEETEEGNYLYGDFQNPTSVTRITGIATVTNEENYPIFPHWVSIVGELEITPSILPALPGVFVYSTQDSQFIFYPWGKEIGAKETITIPFSCNIRGKYEDEGDEVFYLYAYSQKLQEIHFNPKQCTNTYWTADQHVKPLPQEGMELKVPKEAVAVDFRGNYGVDDVFTVDVTEANPNCLYYLNNLDYVPKGLDYDRLVIRDYAIRDLVIDERHDFYCPMPFEAKTALLTVTPEGKEAFDKNSEVTGSCSGTITLPFDAQRIQLTDVNGESTLGQDGLTFFRFAGIRRDLTLLFSPVLDSQLLAYEPCFFNSRPSRIAFSAENITVPATRPAVTHTQYFDFKGTTTAKTGDLCLPWSQENGCFALDVLNFEQKTLRPFNAAIFGDEVLKRLLYEMPTNPPVVKPGETSEDFTLKFPIAILDDENKNNITFIHQLQTSTPQPPTTQGVYSLTGQYLGRSGEVSLKPGLYVIDGKKRIVR